MKYLTVLFLCFLTAQAFANNRFGEQLDDGWILNNNADPLTDKKRTLLYKFATDKDSIGDYPTFSLSCIDGAILLSVRFANFNSLKNELQNVWLRFGKDEAYQETWMATINGTVGVDPADKYIDKLKFYDGQQFEIRFKSVIGIEHTAIIDLAGVVIAMDTFLEHCP